MPDFGELLRSFRVARGLTQRDIASQVKRAASYIAMLEKGDRRPDPKNPRSKPTLTRGAIWSLVERLKLWPPDCDRLLEAAGYTAERSPDEELFLQKEEAFAFKEIWIFTARILDPEPKWFDVVSRNILTRGIRYTYFTAERPRFDNLLKQLTEAATQKSKSRLASSIECCLLPRELFLTSAAIYNPTSEPDSPSMYCCGVKVERDKVTRFYTMDASDGDNLYRFLSMIQTSLAAKSLIRLEDARRVYPESARARAHFGSMDETARGNA